LDGYLLGGQIVQSNVRGDISTQLSSPFEPGDWYLVVGVSEPTAKLSYFGWLSYPHSHFWVPSLTSSCPNAPAQRMQLNMRGYVCTKIGDVRLWDPPYRGAGEVAGLQSGEKFTVIGGAFCADDWSWWQIRTDHGLVGWIPEGGNNVDPYFICPME